MVTGEVVLAFEDSPPAGDGDYVFYLRPDPGQTDFLATGNESLGGVLPAEIPAEALDQFTELPQTGMQILILGAWVQNTNRRDWSEFNPVWYWFELPRIN